MLEEETLVENRRRKNKLKSKLMPAGVILQSAGYRRQFRATIVGMQCIKGDVVLPPPFLKRDIKHAMNKGLLLVSYHWTDAS